MRFGTSQTEMCAPQVLHQEGFEKIFWASKVDPFSHYDFQAEKNGEQYFIEVKDINFIFRSITQTKFLKQISKEGKKVFILLIDKMSKKYIFIGIDEYLELCEDKSKQVHLYYNPQSYKLRQKHNYIPKSMFSIFWVFCEWELNPHCRCGCGKIVSFGHTYLCGHHSHIHQKHNHTDKYLKKWIFDPNKHYRASINSQGQMYIPKQLMEYIGLTHKEGIDYIARGKTIAIVSSDKSPETLEIIIQSLNNIKKVLEKRIEEKNKVISEEQKCTT